MKKIISIALLIAMLAMSVCAFASCEAVTAASAIEKADKALTEAPYTMNLAMNFSSDNAEVNSMLEVMNMEIPMTIDGDNVAMSMAVETSGMKISLDMTILGSTLYYNMDFLGQSMKMKTTMTEEQYKDLMEDSNTEMPINATNFETLTLETVDGKQVITCTGITAEGIEALNEIMNESVSDMGAEAAIGDISFVITIADGKYETFDLKVTYAVTVEGETITSTLAMKATYGYQDVKPITAPADADTYEEVDYEDIMG